MIHIVDFSENEKIVVGRHESSNIRINDISVSRYHAYIKRIGKRDHYFLTDNLSKFGTLILIQRPFKLLEHEFNVVQVGNRVIEFDVKRKTRKCLCFEIPEFFNTHKNQSGMQQVYHTEDNFTYPVQFVYNLPERRLLELYESHL